MSAFLNWKRVFYLFVMNSLEELNLVRMEEQDYIRHLWNHWYMIIREELIFLHITMNHLLNKEIYRELNLQGLVLMETEGLHISYKVELIRGDMLFNHIPMIPQVPYVI